jgi:uncharacterized protein
MAKIRDDVEQSIDRFLQALRGQKRIEGAYLYGSQVRGGASEWSDIDLAVVSADFSDDLFEERIVLMRLAAEIDDRIEPWPFTPDRFDSSDPLAHEIRRSGIQLA